MQIEWKKSENNIFLSPTDTIPEVENTSKLGAFPFSSNILLLFVSPLLPNIQCATQNMAPT